MGTVKTRQARPEAGEQKPKGKEKMASKKVKYRLEINYFSKDYENAALETSSPIYDLESGFRAYFQAIDNEKCSDDKEKPVRAWLWEYRYKKDPASIYGKSLVKRTIAKNY